MAEFICLCGMDEVDVNGLLSKKVVGEFGDANEVEVQGDMYSRIFQLFFEKVDENKQVMQVKDASGAEVSLPCSAVCFGSSLLPLAKKILYLEEVVEQASKLPTVADNLPTAQKEGKELLEKTAMQFMLQNGFEPLQMLFKCLVSIDTCLEHVKYKPGTKVFMNCKERLNGIFKSMVNVIREDMTKVEALTKTTLDGLAKDYDLVKMFESEDIEPVMVSKACTDPRTAQLFVLCSQGESGFTSAKNSVSKLGSLCHSVDVFQDAAQWAKAAAADMSGFLDAATKLPFVGSTIGSVTLAQALCRDLQTGETRQGLVHRALQGVQRKGFQCRPYLVKRCNLIIQGKPAGK